MPLGNLTSQFFANVYLNELDYFVIHKSKEQLLEWKEVINNFLKKELKLELHKDKSKIISLSRGIDFVGFRNFYYFKLLRKRNIKCMKNKLIMYFNTEKEGNKLIDSFQGWQAYAKLADTNELRQYFMNFLIILFYRR